ncbi:hypothetical protein ISS05_05640 [Candidatus Woesearchaeota archaeon]|nr:hypothetical protein [Candidatus Woesearchaeota archaeon]
MFLKKSQTAMEFFVLIGLAAITVMIFILASLSQIRDFQDKKEYILLKDLALKLQTEINLAATAEDGYSRQFTISERLDNLNYSITIKNETLIAYSGKSLYAVSIPKITGNITKNTNTITKTGGVVNLN